MITAIFTEDTESISVSGLWQWDYGQILRIEGIETESSVVIDFSLDEKGGVSQAVDAVNANGIIYCNIPNGFLAVDTDNDYRIYAFVYVFNGESGETEKKVKMKVKSRPKPEGVDTPADVPPFVKAAEEVKRYAQEAREALTDIEAIKIPVDMGYSYETGTFTLKDKNGNVLSSISIKPYSAIVGEAVVEGDE